MQMIQTNKAPQAIGAYSQAIRAGNTIYLAGQIPLDSETNTLVNGTIDQQVDKVFENIQKIAEAAGGTLQNIVKLTVYLLDLSNIQAVNRAIEARFEQPFPARTSIQVFALPKESSVEIDAIMVLDV